MSSPEQTPESSHQDVKKDSLRYKLRKLPVRLFMSSLGVGPQGKNYSKVCGLIDGAVFGSDIWVPETETERPFLANIKSETVGFVSYDFNRPAVFPEAHEAGQLSLHRKGRLSAFVLDEVRGNDADERTPVNLLDFRNYDHVMKFSKPTVDELIDDGLVRLVSNAEAYDTIGLYDQFDKELESRRIAEDRVFQITPKGNTLVHLTPDSGDKTPKASPAPERSFGWLPGIISEPVPASL